MNTTTTTLEATKTAAQLYSVDFSEYQVKVFAVAPAQTAPQTVAVGGIAEKVAAPNSTYYLVTEKFAGRKAGWVKSWFTLDGTQLAEAPNGATQVSLADGATYFDVLLPAVKSLSRR